MACQRVLVDIRIPEIICLILSADWVRYGSVLRSELRGRRGRGGTRKYIFPVRPLPPVSENVPWLTHAWILPAKAVRGRRLAPRLVYSIRVFVVRGSRRKEDGLRGGRGGDSSEVNSVASFSGLHEIYHRHSGFQSKVNGKIGGKRQV